MFSYNIGKKISPSKSAPIYRLLKDNGATKEQPEKLQEDQFRFDHNGDAMATEKLSEGIRNFVIDQNKFISHKCTIHDYKDAFDLAKNGNIATKVMFEI